MVKVKYIGYCFFLVIVIYWEGLYILNVILFNFIILFLNFIVGLLFFNLKIVLSKLLIKVLERFLISIIGVFFLRRRILFVFILWRYFCLFFFLVM